MYVYTFFAISQFGIPAPFLEHFVIWFGTACFHLKDLHKITNTGSGDTTYDYVLLFMGMLFSLLLSIIILIIDRKRPNYRQLYLFTIVIARYYVFFTMALYGMSKLFNGQFPANTYSRLDETVGNMSPMGMVWTFMGASRAYTFVSGLLEFTGGILLLFRKTKTVGALFSMAVMLNVTLLNYMYDVPVKIFSTHIVLLCVFILSYDWITLYNFFIRHRSVKLDYNKLRVKKAWMQITLRVIKFIVVVGTIGFALSELWDTLTEVPVPMEGVYTVRTFIIHNDTLPPIENKNDSTGWSKMYADFANWISFKTNAGQTVWKNAKIDTVKKTFNLSNADSTQFAFLNYTIKNDTVTFKGMLQKDTVTIITTRKLKKDFLLTSRGFHWTNEYPANR